MRQTPSRPGAIDIFRHRTYRHFWVASVISNTGGAIQLVGAGWLMATLTSSESMVALVQSAVNAPLMLASYIAGVLADSRDRRMLMLFAQVFMLAISSMLAVVALAGLLTPWLLLACTFLIGLGTALTNPPWQASINDMVPRDDLPATVSMNAMGNNVTRSLGPALGGVIVAAFGAVSAFVINALTYFALIGVLMRWRPPAQHNRLPRENFLPAMGAGLRYLALSPAIMMMALRGFIFGFGGIVVQSLMPLVTRDTLRADATAFGVLLSAFGAGAVIGALNSVRLRRHLEHETIIRLGFGLLGVTCLVLAVSASFWPVLAATLAAGFCWINVMNLLNARVQLATPRWVLGRTISLFMTSIFGGMALGSWTWGEMAERAGLEAAFWGAAAVLGFGLLVGLRFPLPARGDLNLQPLGQFDEPAPRIDMSQRSGPIMVLVEYRIGQGDVVDFLGLIEQRRQIRVRDGARRWSLLRDVQEPDLWLESYHFPTWTDYVRHVERRTVSDSAIIQRLHALNCAGGLPKVHRMIERQTVRPHDDTPPLDPHGNQFQSK